MRERRRTYIYNYYYYYCQGHENLAHENIFIHIPCLPLAFAALFLSFFAPPFAKQIDGSKNAHKHTYIIHYIDIFSSRQG